MDILKINGHDYSKFIKDKGFGWKRNDLDSDKTTRTKDGTMRRDKITTKRTVSFSLMNMTRAELAQLDDDLSDPTFTPTYRDLHGTISNKSFYCSSFSATLSDCYDENDRWTEATFDMIEV